MLHKGPLARVMDSRSGLGRAGRVARHGAGPTLVRVQAGAVERPVLGWPYAWHFGVRRVVASANHRTGDARAVPAVHRHRPPHVRPRGVHGAGPGLAARGRRSRRGRVGHRGAGTRRGPHRAPSPPCRRGVDRRGVLRRDLPGQHLPVREPGRRLRAHQRPRASRPPGLPAASWCCGRSGRRAHGATGERSWARSAAGDRRGRPPAIRGVPPSSLGSVASGADGVAAARRHARQLSMWRVNSPRQ